MTDHRGARVGLEGEHRNCPTTASGPIPGDTSNRMIHDRNSNCETINMTEDSEHLRRQLEEPLLSSQSSSTDNNNDDDDHGDGDGDGHSNTDSIDNNDNTTSSVVTFRGLLFYRFLYFLNGLSASTWGRFGIVYYNTVAHLTPQQIGWLQGLTPLVSFVMIPVWGVLADQVLYSRKGVYLFGKATGTVCLLTLWALGRAVTYRHVFVCIAGLAFFRASGILDASVLDYLGPTHQGQYGTIRLWTAISWGLGAVIMGWITDRWGFQANFLLFGTMMVSMLTVVAVGLPARSQKEQARYEASRTVAGTATTTNDEEEDASSLLRTSRRASSLVRCLCRLPVLLWLLQVVVIGSGMALVDSFLFVYLQNDLSASTRLCGLTVGVTVLIEIPVFHHSEYLLKALGHDSLFVIAMVAYVVRVFGYTLLTESTVHWILALEVLHGLTFACMWISSIDFSAAVTPDEWSTTVQSILSACFSCFGNVVGSILGGWVMQQYSAIVMYRGMGWIVSGTLVVHLIVWCGFGKGHQAYLHSLTAGASVTDENDGTRNERLSQSRDIEDNSSLLDFRSATQDCGCSDMDQDELP